MENTTLYKDLQNIPLADDDPQGKYRIFSAFFYRKLLISIDFVAVLPDDGDDGSVDQVASLDSMSSRFTNDSMDQPLCGNCKSFFSF